LVCSLEIEDVVLAIEGDVWCPATDKGFRVRRYK